MGYLLKVELATPYIITPPAASGLGFRPSLGSSPGYTLQRGQR